MTNHHCAQLVVSASKKEILIKTDSMPLLLAKSAAIQLFVEQLIK
jgi:hypothetical protein